MARRAPTTPPRPAAVRAVARVDRRTKDLARRIERGEIAVIDHRDLDRVAAETLVAAGVSVVVNASPSISGRYPNSGPQRLVEAGIPLVDDVGAAVMDVVREGDVLEVDGGEVRRDGVVVAKGEGPPPTRSRSAWRKRGAASAVNCASSRATRSSTSTAKPTSPSSRSTYRRCARRSEAGTRSWWYAATTTGTTSQRCGRTSASTGRC
jgi:hypothetical protein